MKVKDIFNLYGEHSDKFKLLAGEGGLGRKVSTVEILEVPDGVFWCREEQVIITTGYSLKKEDITLDTFIQVLIDKGVSALGIKVGRYIEQIPKRVLQYAEENNFPIFSVPITFTYNQIIDPINSKLIGKDYYNFNMLMKLRSDLNISMVEKNNIDSIISIASNYLNRKVHILWPVEINKFDKNQNGKLQKVVEVIKSNILQIYTCNDGYEMRNGDCYYTIFKIQSVNNILAFMCVEDEKNAITTTDNEVIREVIQNLTIYILSNPENVKPPHKTLEEFYFSIIKGAYEDKEVNLIEDSKILNVNMEKNRYVWIFKYEENDYYNFNQVYLKVIDIMKSYRHSYLYKEIDNNIVFIVEIDKSNEDIKVYTESLNYIVSEVRRVFKNRCKFKIGVSNIHGKLQSLKLAYDEAEYSIFIGNKIDKESFICFYDDYLIYHLLTDNLEHTALIRIYKNTIERIIGYDSTQNLELYNTIKALIASDFNIGQTSNALFIHRNTLYKRIDKINEVLNFDINASENRVLLQLAIKIHEILSR